MSIYRWLVARIDPLTDEVAPAEVLIVLGAALAADGRLGPALEERVVAGVAAWRQGLAPRVLMTGRFEAAAMRARALELGVPAEAVLVEHTARSTRENALFSSELLRRHGVRSALIVTQPWHRRRAVSAFRKVGVDARSLPFASTRVGVRQLLRECVALVAYGLRGWLALK
jgi:uncharacterized SAM-binding protein YcdF (DUF218 family)